VLLTDTFYLLVTIHSDAGLCFSFQTGKFSLSS